MLKKILLYGNTIRYLKHSQLYWQCIRKIYHQKIALHCPNIKTLGHAENWKTPIKNSHRIFQNDNIIFLNHAVALDNAIFKNLNNQSKLWQYHFHYFNGLHSSCSETVLKTQNLLTQWVAKCPPYTKIAWDPYPISVRIGNIIKYHLNGGALTQPILQSIYLQARYLFKIPEYHLLGNHLLENAKALVFAGVFFQGDEPKKWLRLGMKILKQQIPEQILSDGGYFELSPMYHALMLELLLDLYNLFIAFEKSFPKTWFDRLQKMRFWLKVMTHPDGHLSFFNDAALHIAPTLDVLEAYADRLALPPVSDIENNCIYLKESGYLRLQNKNMVAILDCAKIGPDYQPAHAHADTLSFELSIGQKRCVVNSGTNVYAENLDQRTWQRSTASHSTVEINQQSSSQPWGVFRVAKRAYPKNLRIKKINNEWIVSCSHSGYNKAHTRIWKMNENYFTVEDIVKKNKPAIARYYFHPNFNDIDNKITVHHDGEKKITKSEYYPEFGKAIASNALTICFAESAIVQFEIS